MLDNQGSGRDGLRLRQKCFGRCTATLLYLKRAPLRTWFYIPRTCHSLPYSSYNGGLELTFRRSPKVIVDKLHSWIRLDSPYRPCIRSACMNLTAVPLDLALRAFLFASLQHTYFSRLTFNNTLAGLRLTHHRWRLELLVEPGK